MARKQTSEPKRDPCDNYDGPLRSIGGHRPYNGHFRQTESWWASHGGSNHLHQSAGFTMRFMIVGLADGRWCSDTTVNHIEKNDRQYRFKQETHEELRPIPCVFSTRLAALRAAVAEFVRHVRSIERHRLDNPHWRKSEFGALEAQDYIDWARGIVSAEEWREANPHLVPKENGDEN